MPRITYTGTQTFTATAYTLAPGDELIMTDSSQMFGNIANESSPLISATRAVVQNDGYVHSNSSCIVLIGGSTLTNTGTLESYGTQGVNTVKTVNIRYFEGISTVTNSGTISAIDTSGNGAAVLLDANSILLNTGTITAGGPNPGAAIRGYGSENITNEGTIIGNIWLANQKDIFYNVGTITGSVNLGDGGNILTNHGLIDGAVSLLSGIDLMINDGTITGQVFLGEGNDTLINVGGVITGNIIGSAGSDTITGGSGTDVIYGDNLSFIPDGGNDVLAGGYGNDTIMAGAGNDTVYGNQNDDVLFGNQGSDWIHGGQGNDTIYGGQGSDTVNGGVANDTLFGNLGDDLFVFAPNFGHDTLGDFSAIIGNNDVINFQVGTFSSYAEVQSHMVQQGADVVITLDDANTIVLQNVGIGTLTADHFIFG